MVMTISARSNEVIIKIIFHVQVPIWLFTDQILVFKYLLLNNIIIEFGVIRNKKFKSFGITYFCC